MLSEVNSCSWNGAQTFVQRTDGIRQITVCSSSCVFFFIFIFLIFLHHMCWWSKELFSLCICFFCFFSIRLKVLYRHNTPICCFCKMCIWDVTKRNWMSKFTIKKIDKRVTTLSKGKIYIHVNAGEFFSVSFIDNPLWLFQTINNNIKFKCVLIYKNSSLLIHNKD